MCLIGYLAVDLLRIWNFEDLNLPSKQKWKITQKGIFASTPWKHNSLCTTDETFHKSVTVFDYKIMSTVRLNNVSSHFQSIDTLLAHAYSLP